VDTDELVGLLRTGAAGYVRSDSTAEDLSRSISFALAGQAILTRTDTSLVIDRLIELLERSELLAEELRELHETRSKILHILADEFLTPVTIIQGTAQTLADHPDLSHERAQELADSVQRAGERLRRLVVNLSVAADLDAGVLDVVSRRIAAGDLVLRSATDFLDDARLRLPTDPNERGTLIDVDVNLSVRALVALIENALQFSPPDEYVDVHVFRTPASVEIRVSDNGPGVPDPLRNRIFDLFVQADTADTRRHRGVGVGLYLAARIMSAHRGRIELRDTPGGGSTFVLVFPQADGDTAQAS
jgi:two-component system sensor histidine kinase KdpD